MPKEGERSVRYAYLDLLTTALTSHERNLHTIICRLETVVTNMANLANLEPGERIKEELLQKENHLDNEAVGDLLQKAKDVLYPEDTKRL